jgi:hypothetical protein
VDADGVATRISQSSVYERLNRVLDEKKFDDFAEGLCEQFYAEQWGGPDWRLVSTFVC